MKSILRLIASFGILILILLVPSVGRSNPNDIPHSVLTRQTGTVLSIAFNPKKRNMLACGLSDGRIQVWDTSKHTLQYILYEYKDLIFSLAFSPDGKTLASGNADGTLRLWDVDIGKRRILLTEHTDIVTSLTFSADGGTLASGSADGTIRLWNPDTGEKKKVLQGYEVPVASLAFSPTENILVTGRADNIIRVWDLGTGTLRHILLGHEGPVISLAFSLDGSTLASGSADTTVRLWDMTKDKTTKTLTAHTTLTEHTDWVNSVAFNSTLLASGSHDKTIRLWDANTGEHQHTLTAHTGSVESVAFNTGVAFNADGNTLASGGADGRVLLWKLAPAPDLVVESVTADKITLDPEETFTLTATLKNRGIGRAEAPIYYRWHRSTHPNIHKMGGSDKVLTGAREEIGEKRTAVRSIVELKKTEDVSLGTNQSSEQYIVLTAPQESGIYYYSVCVESPPNESDESDNCSSDIIITVQSPVNIPDSNLRAVIEKELSKNPGATITATDMQTITGLSASHKSITNLTGLELAINLEKLDLSNNQISDVSPLAGLTKLKELDLSDNSNAKGKSITNLTGLELAINLEKLDLSNNQISDVTPLKDLKNLEKLDLSYNSIEDPLYLASLENLTTLDISENPIKFDVGLLTSKKNLKLDLTPYKTTNVFGSTIYYYPDGNKTVLIKGLELKGWNSGVPDNTNPTYLPDKNGKHFKIYGQPNNHTCGHTSALMLLHYYGVKFDDSLSGDSIGGTADLSEKKKYGIDAFNHVARVENSLLRQLNYLAPGTVPSEMVSGLNTVFPVGINYEVKASFPDNHQWDNFLRDTVLQSRPSIILLKLREYTLHWVVVVGYDTKANKFLIADPSPIEKPNKPGGRFKWMEWTHQPNSGICDPSLMEAWSLEYLGDQDCLEGLFDWDLIGWTIGVGAVKVALKNSYYTITPNRSAPYHHLESRTFRIHEEGKSKVLGFWTESTWSWDWNFPGKVIDCKWFFIKQESCSEPDVRWSDKKVTVSGTCEDGKVDKGIIDMFLTVYYEPGGASHPAPSIILSAPVTNTSLLPNYPNPFNPETWIPYQLAEPADVTLTIYDIQGRVVRDLDFGHQRVGMYHSRSRAAHWDGRNAQGESVASGIYFYTLKAGDFRATRKLLIQK